MKNIIGADAAKLAGLQIDTLQKVRNGQITLEHWEWFNNLNKTERDKLVGVSAIESFPIWKTIKLGTGLKTADDFRKALKQGGNKIGNWGNDILGKPAFTASDTETEVDLVNVSVAELGFKNGATRKDIYNKAIELGLELCPNEVGPQLRLQYKDQPNGEWLRIAMEPISDSDGDLSIFSVGLDVNDLWLNSSNGNPDYFWLGSSRFVFVRPRK